MENERFTFEVWDDLSENGCVNRFERDKADLKPFLHVEVGQWVPVPGSDTRFYLRVA